MNIVLILVLMEDTLRETQTLRTSTRQPVLILVLMEDTLRVVIDMPVDIYRRVLILVLMEDTLRVSLLSEKQNREMS